MHERQLTKQTNSLFFFAAAAEDFWYITYHPELVTGVIDGHAADMGKGTENNITIFLFNACSLASPFEDATK